MRAVAGVRPHVRRQDAGPVEGLVAQRALAVLVLCGPDHPFLPQRPTLILSGTPLSSGLLPAALAPERHGGVVAFPLSLDVPKLVKILKSTPIF